MEQKTAAIVDLEEAKVIQNAVGCEALQISSEDFKYGLEIELEHGTQTPECNVSNNHPIATGRIVLAHLKEGLDYYQRLKCMELEMEVTASILAANCERAARKRSELAAARQALEREIGAQIS